jgi:NDP-sugar pyrophosphorylase family protein
MFDDNNRLCGWRNVQSNEERIVLNSGGLHQMAYSCVVVFEPHVFDLISPRGKFSLTELYLSLAPHHLIAGYDHSGDRFIDVGKPESISSAESLFE